MVRCIVKAFVLMAALDCIGPHTFAEEAAVVHLSTFRCDVTPPLDGRSFGGWAQPLTKLEDPLWAKGIVLNDGRGRYVICAMDWCQLRDSTYLLFCRKIAAAARIDASRVAIQCLHQHTAPVGDGDAERLVRQATGAGGHTDLEAIEMLSDRLSAAVKESLQHMHPVDRLGLGQAQGPAGCSHTSRAGRRWQDPRPL